MSTAPSLPLAPRSSTRPPLGPSRHSGMPPTPWSRLCLAHCRQHRRRQRHHRQHQCTAARRTATTLECSARERRPRAAYQAVNRGALSGSWSVATNPAWQHARRALTLASLRCLAPRSRTAECAPQVRTAEARTAKVVKRRAAGEPWPSSKQLLCVATYYNVANTPTNPSIVTSTATGTAVTEPVLYDICVLSVALHFLEPPSVGFQSFCNTEATL